MQNKPSNDQHKSIYYRLRRSDPHERLSARLRHFSFGAAEKGLQGIGFWQAGRELAQAWPLLDALLTLETL